MLTDLFRARDRAPEPACAQAQDTIPTAVEAMAHGTLVDRPTNRRDTQDRGYTRARLHVTAMDAIDVIVRVIAHDAGPRDALRNLKAGTPVTVVGRLQFSPSGLAIEAREVITLSTQRNAK